MHGAREVVYSNMYHVMFFPSPEFGFWSIANILLVTTGPTFSFQQANYTVLLKPESLVEKEMPMATTAWIGSFVYT